MGLMILSIHTLITDLSIYPFSWQNPETLSFICFYSKNLPGCPLNMKKVGNLAPSAATVTSTVHRLLLLQLCQTATYLLPFMASTNIDLDSKILLFGLCSDNSEKATHALDVLEKI
jgi:hypothetical protein